MNDDLYQQVCMDHKRNTVKLAKNWEIYRVSPCHRQPVTFFNRLPVTSSTHFAIKKRTVSSGVSVFSVTI